MEEPTTSQRAFDVYRNRGEELFWLWFERLSEQGQAEIRAQIEELREVMVAFFEIWSA